MKYHHHALSSTSLIVKAKSWKVSTTKSKIYWIDIFTCVNLSLLTSLQTKNKITNISDSGHAEKLIKVNKKGKWRSLLSMWCHNHTINYLFCRRADNTLLVMLYNSKAELINDKIIDCAETCIQLLKFILRKARKEKRSSNENALFIYLIVLADIYFDMNRILNTVKKEMQCRICKSERRCEHNVTTKLIQQCHIKWIRYIYSFLTTTHSICMFNYLLLINI